MTIGSTICNEFFSSFNRLLLIVDFGIVIEGFDDRSTIDLNVEKLKLFWKLNSLWIENSDISPHE